LTEASSSADERKTMKQNILQMILTLALCAGAQAQVNSGSNGSDGAFNPATNTVINMVDHPNGIYQYTSVTISNGVTVTFIPNANNSPVTWLVQGNCEIDGIVNVSGQTCYGSKGGPGGGAGGSSGNNPVSGQGPGGGQAGYNYNNSPVYGGEASFGTAGGQIGTNPNGNGEALPGSVYGNNFLIPLLGGSGGGGGYNADNGAGGGGAILIAANNQINIAGSILANGGDGAIYVAYLTYSSGAAGSGGAIRLVASIISGGGSLSANGGQGFGGNNWNNGNPGWLLSSAGNGRIRLDTFQDSYSGNASGVFSKGYQPIIIPVAGQGVQLSIASVAGAAVSATPNGQLVTPDAIISGQQANPIPIMVHCANLPLNTLITVTVKPASGASVSAVGYNTTGTLASSTATVSLTMPRGGGIIYATAVTSN
jgi:hypothetical protein